MRKIALRLLTTRRQISSTHRHSAFGTISDVGRSNWLLSRVVRESSMFVVGLELLLCQLRRQSDPGGMSWELTLQSSFWNRRGQKQFNGGLATSNLKWAICSRCVVLSRVLMPLCAC